MTTLYDHHMRRLIALRQDAEDAGLIKLWYDARASIIWDGYGDPEETLETLENALADTMPMFAVVMHSYMGYPDMPAIVVTNEEADEYSYVLASSLTRLAAMAYAESVNA